MKNLYPTIDPYNTGMLQVSKQHSIYYEQCGNPIGIVAIVLHGGPVKLSDCLIY